MIQKYLLMVNNNYSPCNYRLFIKIEPELAYELPMPNHLSGDSRVINLVSRKDKFSQVVRHKIIQNQTTKMRLRSFQIYQLRSINLPHLAKKPLKSQVWGLQPIGASQFARLPRKLVTLKKIKRKPESIKRGSQRKWRKLKNGKLLLG